MSPADKAQQGFALVKDAVVDVLRERPSGESTSEIGKVLGLHYSQRKGQHGYVIWTALGHLMKDGLVQYDEQSRLYRLK